jgi:predicted RNase H-like HicB family nuclease
MRATYTIVMVKEPDGRYSVSVPALKGCHTWGSDLVEAGKMAEEAILAYLEGERALGKPVPPPDVDVFTGSLGEADEALVRKVSVPLEEAADTLA